MSEARRSSALPLGILAAIMVGWVLHVGTMVLQPLVIALLLCVILQPVVRGLARFHIPAGITVLLLVLLLFLGLARLGMMIRANVSSFLGEPVASQTEPPSPPLAQSDTDGQQGNVGRIESLLENQNELASRLGGLRGMIEQIVQRLEDSSLPQGLVSMLVSSLRQLDVQGFAANLIGSGIGFTRGLLLVMVFMIFIFAEQTVFKRKILAVSGGRRKEAVRVLDTIGVRVQRYLGVKTLISLITGILVFIILVLLGIPYAALFALLAFLLNYIPTFGSIIAAVFPTLTALAIGPSWGKAVWVLVSFLAINFLLGNFVEPRILGRELNLSPLVIVVSVLFWGALWGVAGAFLAVPLTSALQIVLASQERTHPVALLLSSGPEDVR